MITENNIETIIISQGLGTRSLFVVGDDAQSIYAFRGSKIEIILNFEDEYTMTTEIVLNQNYRSNQQILTLAEEVLTHNPKQKKKSLFTSGNDQTSVKYYTAQTERDEAEFIIRQIHSLYVEGNPINSQEDISQGSKETIKLVDPVKSKIMSEFSIDNLKELLGE